MELLRRAEGAFRTGRLPEAERLFREVLAAEPEQADAIHFLGILAHHAGRAGEALRLVGRSLELRPNWAVFHQNHGGVLLGLGRTEQAAAAFERALELQPDSHMALSSLVMAYDSLDRLDLAARHGQRSLELKDRTACAAYRGPQLDEGLRAPPFDAERPERNIISYSLWGADEYYCRYAIENAIARRFIYPEWTCRFHVDETVPEPVVKALISEGAQVVRMPKRATANEGLFWRFLVANDPKVARFLCRDCDSVINLRERLAVQEWLESGRPFHVMRDNIIHTELILAGMWGGVAGLLPDIAAGAADFLKGYAGRWADQIYLRERIWPMIRAATLTHDRHYRLGETRDFPALGRLPGRAHVGGSMPGKGRQHEFQG